MKREVLLAVVRVSVADAAVRERFCRAGEVRE
jgi:hypothetical protein